MNLPMLEERASLPSLGDMAYMRIRNDIIRCVLAPGAEVSESRLANHYSLGLAAIRKALSRLTQDGLVTPLPRRGYIVTPITVQAIHELMDLRAMLEPAAARKAATAPLGDSTLIEAHAQGPHEYASPGEQLAFIRENRAFHLGISELAGNRLATHVLSGLMDAMERLLHLGLFTHSDEAAARLYRASQRKQHADLLQAIVSKDADAAEQAARDHVEHTRNIVLTAAISNRGLVRI